VITPHDRYFPFIVHVFAGTTTKRQLDTWLGQLDALLDRGGKTLTVVVAHDLKMWDPAMLRQASEWMRTRKERIASHGLAFAFVLPSPVIRGMLKAILWMSPLPAPHHDTSTVADALTWLRPLAQSNRVPLPALADVDALIG
jgi:hypothetical protein